MIRFILALAHYIIDLARWLVTAVIILAELVGWALAVALIAHAFNTYLN